jgi:two-component system, cell cycle sensor histidine kinase and response regulator CckA
VRAAGPRPRLDSMRTVRALVLSAAPLGAIVSAIVGVTALMLTGALPSSGAAASAVAVWWTGDLLGALVIAPLLLAWALVPPSTASARGPLEVVLLCLGTVIAAEAGLGHLLPVPQLFRFDYLYLLFPFVIWAALRFGSRGASLMTFTISVVAVWRTLQGDGPFNAATTGGTLFAVACYLGAVAVTGLLLAAAVTRERETATDVLRRRDEQLRVALDAARMGVWFWSAADNRLTWDDSLRRMYGVGPDERIDSYADFISRVHPDDREFVEGTVRRALAEGGRLDYEFRILLPDGRVRWIADQGRVVPAEDGGPAGMTGACTDVTDRRTAEEQLRLAHHMESVGRLAGGVAHEANNQMSVVIGAAHFILARPDIPSAVRADAEYIRKAAERTAAVTAQLLAFSRRQVLRPQVLDLNGVLETFRPVLQRTMGEDCAVTLRLEPALGHVKADLGQLEQVLLNLALNARDAMPRGGALSVETSSTELSQGSAGPDHGIAVRPGRYVLLAVSDTGHGMDRATLAHVFEPFFTTKGVGEGTGLGLSTVFGIVKQSKGYVTVQSAPGQGTTFRIFLPRATGTPEPAPDTGPRQLAGKETILVVEDQTEVLALVTSVLRQFGYSVLEAASPQQSLTLMKDFPDSIDLIITDIIMPGMTGRQLAGEMERIRPGVRILFMSGYTRSELGQEGVLDEGLHFLQKPFTPEALAERVRAVLSARA